MSDISPSSIKVDQNLESRIAAATSQAEVQALLHEAAIAQHLVEPDRFDPNLLLPVERPTPQGYAKRVVVNGKTHIIEAETEQSLLAAENALFRSLFEPNANSNSNQEQHQEEPPAPARDPATGRFVAKPDAVAMEALNIAFQSGAITAAQYLEKTGAIDQYLESHGVDMATLQQVSQEREGQAYEQSWADATKEFLNGVGSDWPGGQENMQALGQLLIDNPELAEGDKVEALTACFEHMKQNNMLVESIESKISSVRSPQELRLLLQPPERQEQVRLMVDESSGLFGR